VAWPWSSSSQTESPGKNLVVFVEVVATTGGTVDLAN